MATLFFFFRFTSWAGLLEFMSHPAHFPIGAIRFEIVGEDSFPVGFLAIVERMPVPVGHQVGAAEMWLYTFNRS